MPLISFEKGNFRLYVVSNTMFFPGFSSGTLLYCEIIKISIFVWRYYELMLPTHEIEEDNNDI